MNYSAKIKMLQEAIHFKNPLEILYNGETEVRKINPHCVYTSVNGISSLDAFQTQGKTASELQRFKIFHVDKIESIKRLEVEVFEISEQFNFASTRYINSFFKIAK